jgi:imidazolonepropionase-like amidohydrolase
MGVDKQVGTIEPGKIADIVAVRGDLLEQIERLQYVDIVVRKGVRYK